MELNATTADPLFNVELFREGKFTQLYHTKLALFY